MLIRFIQNYLKENNIEDYSKFILQDDGSGIYIKTWNYEIDEPEFPSSDSLELDNVKSLKKEEINKQRDNNINKPILYSIDGKSNYFDRGIVSHLSFINNITVDSVGDVEWINTENKFVNLSLSDFKSICCHIRDRDMMEFKQARLRKDAVAKLKTIEEIDSYDITTVYE